MVNYIDNPWLPELFWGCILLAPIILIPWSLKLVKEKHPNHISEEKEREILIRELHILDDISLTKAELIEKNPKLKKGLRLSPFVASLSLFIARGDSSLLLLVGLIGITLFAQGAVAAMFGWIPYVIVFSQHSLLKNK
ncbi:MAG: hypothetical protein K8R40_03350 [Anaerolineaceae bacterium]|nr:hypothetical protein [Anaerolineaceae bacterium]